MLVDARAHFRRQVAFHVVDQFLPDVPAGDHY
jgi:hypothetical protein